MIALFISRMNMRLKALPPLLLYAVGVLDATLLVIVALLIVGVQS